MLTDIEQIATRLRAAIQTGEALMISYRGGTQYGAKRWIALLRIVENKVMARCLNAQQIRLFKIPNVDLVDPECDLPDWTPGAHRSGPEAHRRFTSPADVVDTYRTTLEELSWHITTSNDEICLFRRRKNGKLLKYPDVALAFHEWVTTDYFNGEDFVSENKRKSPRPWSVRSKRYGWSYGSLDRAVERFLDEAVHFAPCGPPSHG